MYYAIIFVQNTDNNQPRVSTAKRQHQQAYRVTESPRSGLLPSQVPPTYFNNFNDHYHHDGNKKRKSSTESESESIESPMKRFFASIEDHQMLMDRVDNAVELINNNNSPEKAMTNIIKEVRIFHMVNHCEFFKFLVKESALILKCKVMAFNMLNGKNSCLGRSF